MAVRVGIVGCGDVATRTYFPGFGPDLARGAMEVTLVFDPLRDRAEAAAKLFPGARVVDTFDAFLSAGGVDLAVNLGPMPMHYEANTALLKAGMHVYTEKTLAATVAESQALIALAASLGKQFMSAPAVMATNRMRWLKTIVASGRLGRPTLAIAQQANMGPHAWRQYTGDPRVHYSAAVGPMIDTGVYALHGVTGLLGAAKRVQATGGISIPERTILVDRYLGEKIQVKSNDHMLIQLDFGDNTFGQVLSSFATPRTKQPGLELHCSKGSVSISSGNWYDANGSADFLFVDETPQGIEGW
ncbi:MAG TPA: Gfo/Idh/MocA family oxidoreductase, partial [Thermomicrobiales bacterium]|nr:Gfo/Idh/MocA family oxidoreductase [Thermomicrobiales bacterium]